MPPIDVALALVYRFVYFLRYFVKFTHRAREERREVEFIRRGSKRKMDEPVAEEGLGRTATSLDSD